MIARSVMFGGMLLEMQGLGGHIDFSATFLSRHPHTNIYFSMVMDKMVEMM